MDRVYWLCALVGGTIMVLQFLLTVVGLGGDHDHDVGGGGHDAGPDLGHDSNWLFSVISIRTIVAGLAFFGLTGTTLQQSSLDKLTIAACSAAAGVGAILIVYWTIRWLSQLNADGTTYVEQAVGATGTVYLTIPAEDSGAGKVHVSVGERRVEYKARTPYAELPTGAPIVVLRVVDSGTLEVASLETVEAARADQG